MGTRKAGKKKKPLLSLSELREKKKKKKGRNHLEIKVKKTGKNQQTKKTPHSKTQEDFRTHDLITVTSKS